MATRYNEATTPRGDDPDKLIAETSRGIASLNQLTRSMQQKMSLFQTPQDSRSNRQQLNELADKGNKHILKLNKRLQLLNKNARSRKTQVTKLAADFRAQVVLFEEACAKLTAAEKSTIAELRRTSGSFQSMNLNNQSESQVLAQAQVVNYDEQDLARREEEMIHINHQLREVHAAFQEVDDLVREQGEVVVEIEGNVNDAKDDVENALENVRQADASAKCCKMTKFKMICYGTLLLIVIIMVITLVATMTGDKK
ncbi:TPA: hypothetical protein N0F65_003435 [Lagenidium giganteum]|uniref:t-SNARE coiled-coil homology domain-containing protein n=1 Tax=Lagenidium giganteum TaxID=4803 RepID=A0AAV2YKI2_9STRA|nr:TPA: hypothetical protein N0F65_003435 [Lagenidium giganteum]